MQCWESYNDTVLSSLQMNNLVQFVVLNEHYTVCINRVFDLFPGSCIYLVEFVLLNEHARSARINDTELSPLSRCYCPIFGTGLSC